jgi:hypothetical protein
VKTLTDQELIDLRPPRADSAHYKQFYNEEKRREKQRIAQNRANIDYSLIDVRTLTDQELIDLRPPRENGVYYKRFYNEEKRREKNRLNQK